MNEKAYEVIELPDGRPGRRYPNGIIRDEWGHIQSGSETKGAITKENAREMQKRGAETRRRNFQAATRRGIAEAAETETVSEAIQKIMKKRAEVALTDDGRAGNDATKLLMMALDVLPRKEDEKKVVHEHTVSDEAVRFFEKVDKRRKEIEEERKREAIDGRILGE